VLSFTESRRFYLYGGRTDMRKSFDGLGGLIHREMGRDPLSGDVYVFVNRRRDRIKFLVWESDGYWIWYKRLEKGTFRLPRVDHIIEPEEDVSGLVRNYVPTKFGNCA